jgi:hypothetical protein
MNGEGKYLLVAIMYTPYGEHFKEIYSNSVLNEVRATPMATKCFALNENQIAGLNAGAK